MLALAGGLLGLGVGYGMLRATSAMIPQETFPSEADLRLNVPILLVMFAVTTVCGLLFGSIPAWYASHVSPGEALKEGGRAGTGAGRHRLRRVLVVAEFALALPLLAGAGLAVHSFWNLRRIDLGVRTDHVLTFGLEVPENPPDRSRQVRANYREMLDRIKAVPGVRQAAVTTGIPLRGLFGLPFPLSANLPLDPTQRQGALFRMVTPEYFQTFGIQVLKRAGDYRSRHRLRRKSRHRKPVTGGRFLKGSDPLQQRLMIPQIVPGAQAPGSPIEWQIIGVIHNVRAFGFREDFPEIVVPFARAPGRARTSVCLHPATRKA